MKCYHCRHFNLETNICDMDNMEVLDPWEDFLCDLLKDQETEFQRITKSPEALAEKLVYRDEEHKIAFSVVIRGKEQKMEHECWRSTIIPGDCWAEYDRAYAATVARLKEVEK